MDQYNGKRGEREKRGKSRRNRSADDPFFNEKLTFGERVENFFLDLNWFFHSKKGKLLVGLLCGVIVLGVAGFIAADMWVKPPELPTPPAPPVDTQTPEIPDQNEEPGNDDQEEHVPTDDELYPDDGYGGEMPTVSGERKKGVYTFLVVGTDMDDGNTDTIMVVSYDTVNQAINIMSIPRDTMINESWDLKKINSVYSRTGNSIQALAKRVAKLVGFMPDFYVKVDLSVFVELVDLVGGVDFYVPQDMKYDDPYQDLHIDLKAGQQVLDGEKAMQLVRFRGYAEGDIRRVAVQQDFLKALIKECLSLKHWGKIKAYIKLAMDNIQTDLEMGSVVWFAANVLGLNEAPTLSMYNVNTYTIPGNYWASTWSRATSSTQSYVTIYVNKTLQLVNQYFNPYVQDVTADMIDAMSILENGDIASSTGVLKDTTHNEVMAVRRGEAYYDEEGNIVYIEDEPTIPGEEGEGEGEGEGNTEGEEGTVPPKEGGEGTEPSGEDTPGTTPDGGENTDNSGEGEEGTGETSEPEVPEEPEEPEIPADGDVQ